MWLEINWILLIGFFGLLPPQMSHNIGHTDSDGMISDMAEEGSGLWRSHQFSDDSDFGVDGSGSGDGYTGEFREGTWA